MFKLLKNKNHFNFAKKLFGVIFVCIFLLLPVVPAASTLIAPAVAQAQGGADMRSDMQSRAQLQSAGDTTAATQNKTENLNIIEKGLAYVASSLITGLGTMIIGVSSALLWMSAEVFELVIGKSVLGLHNYIGPGSAVASVWKTLRDIGNMFFIFILVYTAVMTVLGLSNTKIKELITKVVLFAILINFSFFFTKVAIDASNIVSVAFYNQIVQTRCGTEGGNGQAVGNIGTAFMCHLGITSFFDRDVLTLVEDTKLDGFAGTWKILQFSLMASVFILITAFVFAAAALMFVMRFVTLIILLATAPLAFAFMAFPKGKDKYSSMWSEPLVNNCILAPVYMFATWIVLQLLQGITGGNSSLLRAILGNQNGTAAAGAGDAILSFIAVIAMMVATLWVASKFGGYGAKGAIKSLAGAQGWVQGKVGRGVVRALPIARIDKAISESRVGQNQIVRSLRESTTGAALKAKFGSKQSVSDVDKELKKQREDYAKSRGEKVDEENSKADSVRREWITIMQDPLLSDSVKLDAHKKLLDAEKNRLKNAQMAYTSARDRKAFGEAAEIQPEITTASDRIKALESDLKNWEENKKTNRGTHTISQPSYINDIIKDTSNDKKKGGNKGLIQKAAKLGAAAITESTDRDFTFAGVKLDKTSIGKAAKWVYGGNKNLQKAVVKKLRDDAKKGKDVKTQLREILGEEAGGESENQKEGDKKGEGEGGGKK